MKAWNSEEPNKPKLRREITSFRAAKRGRDDLEDDLTTYTNVKTDGKQELR